MTEEEALEAEVRSGRAYLGRGAVWKGGNAQRVAQAKSLIDLGIDPDFAARPGARACEESRVDSLVAAVARIETVGPAVGRRE